MATRKETSIHRDAYEAWYAASRNFRKISENLGIKSSTLYGWADVYFWHERADRRDQEAARIADEAAAQERAKRQLKRRQSGELLAAKGRKWLVDFDIDSAKDAINAIRVGAEIERKEDGVPDWVLMILNADTNDLEAMAKVFGGTLAGGDATGAGDDSLSPETESDESD